MTELADVIAANEDWLVKRVVRYAKEHGYGSHVSTLIEAWRSSIAGLSNEFIQTIALANALPNISAELDANATRIASFGVAEARLHRTRGVSLELYFGLMKYYRQSYLDLLQEGSLPATAKARGRVSLERYFDLVEVGFIAEWERLDRANELAELQLANLKITNEKNLFLTIYESLPVPVLVLDSQSRIMHLNHAALSLEESTLPGQHYYRRDDQSGARILGQLSHHGQAGEQATYEREIETREGTRWFKVSTHPLLDISEKFCGTVLVLNDVTPLKHAEQQSRELSARQELVVQTRTAELLVANGKLLQQVTERQKAEVEIQRLNADLERRVTQRTEELHQLDQQNTSKLKELTLLHQVSSLMLSTVRLNKLVHLILSALTSGSDPCFERAMLFMINERSGVMQGMLGVTADPTAEGADLFAPEWDLTEEEMARRDSAEFSSQVRGCRLELNRSRNLASRAVLDKKVVFVADTAKEKRVDRELVERFGITSFAVAPLMSKSRTYGIVLVDNPHSRRPISTDALRLLQLFTSQAGIAIENSMLYNSLEDTNRRLRDAQEQLIHGERLATIGEMAAGIAHELKGPLVSIGGFARRLARKIPPASQEAGYVSTIVSEVQRLEKMLTDTLSFSRKTTICYAKCTVAEIIEEALAIVSPALEKSRINVERHYPRKTFFLHGDCQQLEQVFINLFFNAQEAMKEQGSGTLQISVTSAKFAGKKAVAIRVADTGGGIPLASLNNIFHSFYTTKQTGTGLGLPIANRIVTNHGGKIQVANRPGEGAEFTVILPRQE